MISNLTKGWLPSTLYGRAALILILPVITLQLVVSVVFIQRHFEGVTRQMTTNLLVEVQFLLSEVDRQADAPGAARRAMALAPRLGLAAQMPAPLLTGERRVFYDLSGRVVVAMLEDNLPGLRGVDLASDLRAVRLSVQTRHGPMQLVLPRERVSASNPHQLLLWMIFTGVLMTLISYAFLRAQLRPIRRLARAAEAFGKGRHVAYLPGGAREVRSAGRAFIEMRARIERHIEQRTLMLSGISHDLRTPLTRLKLALSLCEDTPDIAEMRRDVSDMQRLVDEFLAFARGDALDDPEPVDVAALLRRLVEEARGSGAPVALGPLDETGPVELRPMAVSRAVDNLVGNAVRYGNHAQVSLMRLPDAVCIRVEDDGPGIPAEARAEALKPFSRLDPSRNQNDSAGVGLGLAIATDIARKHGGRLELAEGATLGGLRADLILAV